MAVRPSIKLNYDIVSPFSYIAFETLTKYRDAWNVDLDFCPTFLGGIMFASKNQTPASHPLKQRYMNHDLERLGKQYRLTINMPEDFPNKHNTMNVVRFLRQVKEKESPKVLEDCTRRLYLQMFTHSTFPTDPEFLLDLTPSILSRSRFDTLLAESQSDANKARVKEEAQVLVKEQGCYGFPWISAQKTDGQVERWFGSDRMEAIAFWLGDGYKYEGPFPPRAGPSKL